MRKKQFTDENLKDILISFAQEKREKITYSLLEKETGIGRQTWKRRMSNDIKVLNTKLYLSNKSNNEKIILPNVADTVNKFYYSKEKLIENLLWYNDTIQSLYIKVEEISDLGILVDNLKNEVKDVNNKNILLKEELEYYKNLYLRECHKNSTDKGLERLQNVDKKEYKQRSKLISLDPIVSEWCPSLFNKIDSLKE